METIIDSMNDKWRIIKNGDFNNSYYAQRMGTNTKIGEYPFIANMVNMAYQYQLILFD